jgi:hypothetical protein
MRACAAPGVVSGADDAPTGSHPLLRSWCGRVRTGDVDDLPELSVLETWRKAAQAADGLARPEFRAQDADLVADGLHYEMRIAAHGVLATRERNPHDFFNALVWLRHARLKRALNARQVADIRRVGPKQRTRGQCALTHFDEAGAIVWLADPALLALWDTHDWTALFGREREAWGPRIAVTVFGHALVEHVWNGHCLPVAKALVVDVPLAELTARGPIAHGLLRDWPFFEARVAEAIASGAVLADPQELRPLPLAGLPGWHVDGGQPTFLEEAPCFRPLRSGRRYPLPMRCI